MRCPIKSWDGQAVCTFCARLTLDRSNLLVKMLQKFKEGSQTLAAPNPRMAAGWDKSLTPGVSNAANLCAMDT
ncbi:hypothetical protein CRENBAI_021510 [Crenichthys baileyi]|uniref:Uncharacterized protein n=1 Tax=Crenichthys baileyi TaxID=28760 RepID=A0AAV9QSG8_9TELE